MSLRFGYGRGQSGILVERNFPQNRELSDEILSKNQVFLSWFWRTMLREPWDGYAVSGMGDIRPRLLFLVVYELLDKVGVYNKPQKPESRKWWVMVCVTKPGHVVFNKDSKTRVLGYQTSFSN